MKLTGKAKLEFDKWIKSQQGTKTHSIYHLLKGISKSVHSLPDNMKYGAYEDFFQSIGVYIHINRTINRKRLYEVLVTSSKNVWILDPKYSDDLPMARRTAIKMANKSYNAQGVHIHIN